MAEPPILAVSGRRYWRTRSANAVIVRDPSLLRAGLLREVLLVLRGRGVDDPGTWGLPGGYLEDGEDFEQGLLREMAEELGAVPTLTFECHVDQPDEPHFNRSFRFRLPVDSAWAPTLNEEHTAYYWASPDTASRLRLHRYAAETLRLHRLL